MINCTTETLKLPLTHDPTGAFPKKGGKSVDPNVHTLVPHIGVGGHNTMAVNSASIGATVTTELAEQNHGRR